MSFVNKFKQANSNTNPLPQGVKLENTSFGQPNNTYTKPQFYPQQQPSTTHQKGKPRGGWDDEEEDEPGLAGLSQAKATFTPSQTANNVAKPVLLISTSNKVAEQPSQAGGQQEFYKKFAVVPIDERFEQSHEYEVKVVGELIQPGGARLRQPDSVLNEFCKAAENFQIEVVGSILLNSLSCEGIWISKARAIFAIEALVKNIAKYYSYFKHNIKHLRRNEFENEGLNASQLTKFLDDLIDYLEDPERGFSSQMQQDIIPVIVSSTEPNSSASPEEIPVKAYSQSAVYSTHPGLLTSQLASESVGMDSPIQETSAEQPKPAASFLSKFKAKAQAQVNVEQKNEENILDSLSGLNFNEEVKPQQQQEPEQPKKSNFDDVYNLYLNSGPQMNYGNMQYANMQNPNMNNMGYQQYQQQQQYGNRMNGYTQQQQQQQQQQYYAMLAARQNQAQYQQGQRNYIASPVVPAEQPVSSEDYYKRKQQEENEKRFDNLKFGF